MAVPLIELGALAVAFLCIALALIIIKLMQSVGDTFRPIPVVGGAIAGAVESVARGIAHVLGKAESGIDAAIGASWHLLARSMDWTWHYFEGIALGYYDLAALVLRLTYAHSGLKSLVHHSTVAVHSIAPRVRTLEREWRGIEHKVKRIERELAHGIGNDVRTGLRDLRKEVEGIDAQVTTAIPKAIDHAEGLTASLRDFIKAIPSVSYAEWVAGIVAAALGAEILNSLRCPSFLRSAKNRGCGMWDGLENMLGWFVDLFIITDLCDVIPLLDKAYSEVAAPAVALLTEAIDAMPCVAGNQPPALAVPALHLPSNPGYTLSLP